MKFQEKWGPATHACFLTVYKSTKMVAEWCIDNRFKRFGKLAAEVKYVYLISRYKIQPLNFSPRSYVLQLIEQQFAVCMGILHPILEAEKTPYTQNTHYLSESCAKWIAKYKDVRSGKNNMLEPPAKKRKLSEDISEGQTAASPSPFGSFGSPGKPITFTFTNHQSQD